MPIVSRHRCVPLTAVTTAILVITSGAVWLGADIRQVPVEGLIYDLKHPDAVRRQTAVRELGAAVYKPAIPHLVALANDLLKTEWWMRRRRGLA